MDVRDITYNFTHNLIAGCNINQSIRYGESLYKNAKYYNLQSRLILSDTNDDYVVYIGNVGRMRSISSGYNNLNFNNTSYTHYALRYIGKHIFLRIGSEVYFKPLTDDDGKAYKSRQLAYKSFYDHRCYNNNTLHQLGITDVLSELQILNTVDISEFTFAFGLRVGYKTMMENLNTLEEISADRFNIHKFIKFQVSNELLNKSNLFKKVLPIIYECQSLNTEVQIVEDFKYKDVYTFDYASHLLSLKQEKLREYEESIKTMDRRIYRQRSLA